MTFCVMISISEDNYTPAKGENRVKSPHITL